MESQGAVLLMGCPRQNESVLENGNTSKQATVYDRSQVLYTRMLVDSRTRWSVVYLFHSSDVRQGVGVFLVRHFVKLVEKFPPPFHVVARPAQLHTRTQSI